MENRIRMIMESEHLSQQEFAQKLGLSPATLSNIFNGRTRATNNHVQAIHKAFPQININWLLFGEGQMLNEGASPAEGREPLSLFSAEGDDGDMAPGIADEEGRPGGFGRTDGGEAGDYSQAGSGGRRSHLATHGGQAAQAPTGLPQELNLALSSVKVIDNRPRKIKEIRVFYDDGTYESFVPSR